MKEDFIWLGLGIFSFFIGWLSIIKPKMFIPNKYQKFHPIFLTNSIKHVKFRGYFFLILGILLILASLVGIILGN